MDKKDQRIKNLQQKSRYIKDATERPSIARVFFLILDGIDYTKAIAQAYYSSGNNVKMKSLPNPKVIAIYLSNLKGAGLIKKKEKDGKIQRYEIDWNGLFDLLSLGGIGEFSEAYWNVGYGDMDYEEVKNINQFFVDNFVKPYFEKRKEELKLAYGYLKTGGKINRDCIFRYPLKEASDLIEKHGKDFCTIPKNFDNTDFCLEDEIKIISSLIVGPYYYNHELVIKFLKNKANRSNPLYPIFDFIKKFNEMLELGERTQFDDSKRIITEKMISILEK